MADWSINGVSDSATPDEDSAATNRVRAVAALEKIAAAQDTISDAIDEVDADLVVLNDTPTNAEVLAVVINMAERQRAILVRQRKLGDYLTAIIKFVIKAVKNGT